MMNKNKKVNILVVGRGMYVCGRGTEEYGTIMPAICEWKRNGNLGEVYVAGTSPESISVAKQKIDELQRNMGIKIHVKYFPENNRVNPECYKNAIHKIPKPAVCIVAVPDNLHSKIAGDAIKEDLHTLVVKPLAPTLQEVRELIDLGQKKRVYCAVEFHKRFDCANLKLKDTISQGIIGDPLYFLVEYSQRKSIPQERFKKWVTSTNIFQYLGIHYVDIIYFATGATPLRAMAIGQKEWLAKKAIDTYDSIQGIIEWETTSGKKFTSHILTNWIDPEKTSAMSDQKIKVIGTKGRFESDQKKRGITIVSDKRGIEVPNPYFSSAYGAKGQVFYRGYGIESIHQFLNDVIQIEKGAKKISDLEDKRPTFKQSIVPTAVLEAINKSLKSNGEWITVQGHSKIWTESLYQPKT